MPCQAGQGRQQGANRTSTFKGATEEMNGHVFECYDEQTDRGQFVRTIEELHGYVKKKLKFYEDISPLFAADMAEPAIKRPEAPAKIKVGDVMHMDETDEVVWKEELKAYVQRRQDKDEGQGLQGLRLEGKGMRFSLLLKQIKAVTLQFDEKRNCFISLLDAKTNFYNCKQKRDQTCDSYRKELKDWVDIIEYHGGTVAEGYELVPETDNNGNARSVPERKVIARDRTIAIAYVRGADPSRYGTDQGAGEPVCSREGRVSLRSQQCVQLPCRLFYSDQHRWLSRLERWRAP